MDSAVESYGDGRVSTKVGLHGHGLRHRASAHQDSYPAGGAGGLDHAGQLVA